MNRRHVHTTAVCISLWWSGGLCVVWLPAGSWHKLVRRWHGLCMRCVVSCGSTSFPWLEFFFGALLWGSMIRRDAVGRTDWKSKSLQSGMYSGTPLWGHPKANSNRDRDWSGKKGSLWWGFSGFHADMTFLRLLSEIWHFCVWRCAESCCYGVWVWGDFRVSKAALGKPFKTTLKIHQQWSSKRGYPWSVVFKKGVLGRWSSERGCPWSGGSFTRSCQPLRTGHDLSRLSRLI